MVPPLTLAERRTQALSAAESPSLPNANGSRSRQSSTPAGTPSSRIGSLEPEHNPPGPRLLPVTGSQSSIPSRRRRGSDNDETSVALARHVARQRRLSPDETTELISFAKVSQIGLHTCHR